MKEIYLIRHAESEMNLIPHIVGGRSNETPITKLGIEQSKKLGENLKKIEVKPDYIYTSGAVRTNDTAKISMKKAGIDMDFVISEELQELHQGDSVGKDKSIVYDDKTLKKIKEEGKDFKLPGGESMNDVSLRIYKWIEDNIKNHNGNIFLVYTHGVAIKCLLSHINNWSQPKTYQTVIDNTSVSKVILKEDKLHIEYINKKTF